MKGNIRKYFKSDWNVICDVCGRKRKRSECVLSYGSGELPVIMACREGGCADPRHPLNSPPPVILDGMPVPDARPPQPDIFISTNNYSGMTWFKLPKAQAGTWFNLNGINSSLATNPQWTWLNFSRS